MRAAVPTVIALIAAFFAVRLHLNGHTLGDDFTLYLRQAQSIFEGNTSQVVDDNRFSVLNSPPGFSPVIYPWGWPLLLSPFVQWWGLDLDRLKLIEVALLCLILVWVHGVVRRRTNRWIAAAVMLAMALTPVYLRHTDQLLTEFPHLAAVLLVVWWIDRMLKRADDPEKPWLTASRVDLIIVGLLAVVAYNMRREGIVFFGVFAAGQAVDVIRTGWQQRGPRREENAVPMTAHLRQIAVPHASMFAGIVLFQLLIPSMLVPDNGGGLRYIPERIGDAFRVIPDQLGLGKNVEWGTVLIIAAVVGMALACWRDTTRNVPLVALVLLSTVTVSTHFRLVDRYFLQVTPFVLFFAAYALYVILAAIGQRLVDDERRTRIGATAVVCAPLLMLAPFHYTQLIDDFEDVDEFNSQGRVQWGPGHADFQTIFAAVEAYTPPDAIIGFFRARTLTLYTDRRTVQPGTVDTMAGKADYYAMQKYSEYSQPLLTDEQAAEVGLEKVWEDKTWVLWSFPSARGEGE